MVVFENGLAEMPRSNDAIGDRMNPVAWILDADKTYPEPAQLPESLTDADALTLAEARSRLQRIAQVTRELVKLVDVELAGALQGSAMLYGQDVYRPSNGKGTAKVKDEELWWRQVMEGLQDTRHPDVLLAALYPASSVRLTALRKLENVLGLDEGELKREYFVYEPSTNPLSVMPVQKAPKFLQDLDEGEIRPVT